MKLLVNFVFFFWFSALASLAHADRIKDLASLAFPIISGGVFRGGYSLKTIVKTAFDAIVGNEKELKSIIFYGFSDTEVRLLCRELDSHVKAIS